MKCIIFGGGGFIGSAISDRLLKDNHHLKIFERPRVEPYRLFLKNEVAEWISGDISSAHDVSEAIKGSDVVLHLVSTTLPKSSNDDPIYDVQSNLVPSLQILNAMVKNNVKRIIFISSGGTVYGNPEYLPIDEKHPTNPLVSYGITKLSIEKYLNLFEHLHGIKAISLRVANPYGERQRIETAQGAVGIFISNAIKNLPIKIWGDGSVTRDYIHVTDVAEAFAIAINYNGSKNVFNISSGIGTSLNQLVNLIENCTGKPIDRQFLPSRPFDVPTSILCNASALKELNWKPSISMVDGVSRTTAWVQANFIKN